MNDNKQQSDKSNTVEFDKIYLQQNVIPSIQSSVKNRYFLIVGFIGYIGLAVKDPTINNIRCLASIGLIAMAVLNHLNYVANARSQLIILERYEVKTTPSKYINNIFLVTYIFFVFVGFIYLNCFIENNK